MTNLWSQFVGAEVIDLSQPMFRGMPQSPNHPTFRMVIDRRHGDAVSPAGGSGSNEMIITGCHVGTHIDALSHYSFKGKLFGGVDANSITSHLGFSQLGIETVRPFLCRGIFLDIAKLKGVEILPADSEITLSDVQASLVATNLDVNKGDVVLIGSGWAKTWGERDVFQGQVDGAPGINEEAAQWLASKKIRAAGGETIAFEHIPAGAGHRELPVHRVFLAENGIHIIETMKLTELAEKNVTEFLFVLSPLNLVGATGSPIRPLAVIK
jgi:kynurenine formamidase